MSTRVTDAISAGAVALVVWVVGRSNGRTPRELLRPAPFLGGAILAFVIECAFARWPALAGRLWRRPAVRVGSPIALAVGTLLTARREGAAPFAVTLGGLAGYFAVLLGIVSGAVPEPATWFERRHSDRPTGQVEPDD